MYTRGHIFFKMVIYSAETNRKLFFWHQKKKANTTGNSFETQDVKTIKIKLQIKTWL